MRIPSAVALVALISLPLFGGVNRWTTSIASVGVVGEVVADPAGANVYARTTAGVFRSTDGGHRWRAINDGLPEPSNLLAFVAAGDALYASSGQTVFASFDEGEHWQRRGSPGAVAVTILAFDRTFNTLLAGTDDGAYYSSDRGKTWVPQKVSFGHVGQLVVASNVAFMQSSSGLFRSKDGGKTWEGVKRVAYDFYANPSSAAVYGIAGQTIQYTADQGNTWTRIPWPNTSIVHSVQPVGADLYVAADSGVFMFDGQSGRWQLVGSTAIAARSLAVTPTSPRRLFAAPATGVLTLREGDRDWITANDGLPRTAAHDVDTPKTQPPTAYAATDAGLLRTDDAGRDWTKVGAIAFASRVAVGSQSPDTAYAAVSTLMKTNDGGATWKSVTPSYPAQFALAPSNPETLYATFANDLKRSVDGGGTWSSIVAGLPVGYYDLFYGFATLTVDPTNDSALYVGRDSGLYRTTDGGATWLQLSSEPALGGLVVDPADPSRLYATAGFTSGVRKSVDGGKTWTAAGLTDKRIGPLAIAGSHVYAGSSDGRVYRSDDAGQHWSGFDEGLGRGAVWRIAVDPDARLLYAATAEGVFDFQVSDEKFQVDRIPTSLQLPRDTAFVLPVIGKGDGASGSFTTDVTLTNARRDAQQVVVIWLPQAGGSATATSLMVTIPSGVTTVSDVGSQLGISGIGSLVFLPADDSLSASARIWTDFHDDRAPASQSIAPASGSALNDHTQLTVTNLRHDSEFRTNTGIVNLSNDTHQFTIQINGQRSSGQVTIAVPPWSLVQISIPEADYGDLSLVAIPDSATAFLFYGSLIDRSTGGAQTLIGSEPQPPPSPPPVLTEEVWIRGNVYDGATSQCIDGALIEVVGDPRQSSRAANQCGQPFDDNYLITGMEQGAAVTFRVSANGYRTQEFPVTILGDIDDQMFINFKLEKQ